MAEATCLRHKIKGQPLTQLLRFTTEFLIVLTFKRIKTAYSSTHNLIKNNEQRALTSISSKMM